MSTVLRLFTLLTIAAASFALPMTCAQGTSAAAPMTLEISAISQIDALGDNLADMSVHDPAARSITRHLFDTLPLDCGDGATPRVTEQPATFDTQPAVSGYLVFNLRLVEESSELVAPLPALSLAESRAGPPDLPPPKSLS